MCSPMGLILEGNKNKKSNMFQTAIFQSARILVSLADQYDSDLHGIVN